MRRVGFCLVGAGAIAPKYVRAFKNSKEMTLMGVHSRNEERGRLFAAKYEIKWFKNFEEVLKDKESKVVLIVTENETHGDIAMRVLDAGKHVVVEKPIDVDLKKAKRLVEKAKRKGLLLSVVSQLRFSPLVVETKKRLERGEFGKIKRIRIVYESLRALEYFRKSFWRNDPKKAGGGVVIMQVIHFLDILVYLFGVPKVKKAVIRSTRPWLKVEDECEALLKFENGIPCELKASNNMKKKRIFLEIVGEKRRARISTSGYRNFLYNFPRMKNLKSGSLVMQLEDVAHAIRSGREPFVKGEDAVSVLSLVKEIYQRAD
ncbi:MAG TPA: Gfo/Idh/MocA family oxidoreductase [Candidatus Nanoarchaeia archaeon]|nr:Gfo/Idh/MocA family oxidoreductase [Candidatus Nanoarchaeia archaeon]